MKRRAVLFDLDGTLLDTLADLADSMNSFLEDFGMPKHPIDPYRYFIGEGMENLATRAAPAGTDHATILKIAEAMGTHYHHNWKTKTALYPGVAELLDTLDQRGIKMAILSNKPDVFTQLIVKHFFGENRFSVVFGSRAGIPKKPDPFSALEIAGKMGLEAADFLYIGDSNVDMRTGQAAGMFTLGVSWGFRSVKELVDAGANAIINKPAEALNYLN